MTACSALTRNGLPCRFPPPAGHTLCANHNPANHDAQAHNRQLGTAASIRNRRARAQARSRTAIFEIDAWALADRASVQAILDTVIRLELAGRLPKSRVRNLLRALSIAVRNFDAAPGTATTGRTSRHNLDRYRRTRTTLHDVLDTLLAEAANNDQARRKPPAKR